MSNQIFCSNAIRNNCKYELTHLMLDGITLRTYSSDKSNETVLEQGRVIT